MLHWASPPYASSDTPLQVRRLTLTESRLSMKQKLSEKSLKALQQALHVLVNLHELEADGLQAQHAMQNTCLLGGLLGFWPECLSLPLVPASELLFFLSSVPLSDGCSDDLGLEACLACCSFRCIRRLLISGCKVGPLLSSFGPGTELPSAAAFTDLYVQPHPHLWVHVFAINMLFI